MARARLARPSGGTEYVQLGDQHVKLQRGALKVGALSIDFHHPAGNTGFDAYCCSNDFQNCRLRDPGKNCADGDRPITVWKFLEQ